MCFNMQQKWQINISRTFLKQYNKIKIISITYEPHPGHEDILNHLKFVLCTQRLGNPLNGTSDKAWQVNLLLLAQGRCKALLHPGNNYTN